MFPRDWHGIDTELTAACAKAGFDLVKPLQVGWYNDSVDPPYDLPDFGAPTSLAFVVGNTRALWDVFLAAIDGDAPGERPIDDYAERTISEAARAIGVRFAARFAPDPMPRRVAMQRLAHVAGLAFQSSSHLSVHPTYGPWIGLRAALVFDVRAPDLERPSMEPPCDCATHCAPALEQALAAGHPDDAWRAWLAVRDACPVGRTYRYTDAQIRYHYTKDRSLLRDPESR